MGILSELFTRESAARADRSRELPSRSSKRKGTKPSQDQGWISKDTNESSDGPDAKDRVEVREVKPPFPEFSMTLKDRIQSHRGGSLFKYAVISSKPPKNAGVILDRLRTFKPPIQHEMIRIDDLPPLLLKDDYLKVDLSRSLQSIRQRSSLPFCMITDVFIHYVPLSSFYSKGSTLNVEIIDNRILEESVVRRASVTRNASYNILMSLDYCIETKDLGLIDLSFTTHNSQFKKGLSWGMAKILVGLNFFDVAQRFNIQETLAVIQWSESDLQDFVTDPKFTDVVITPEALKQLKERFRAGEIEDLTNPRDDEMIVNTAATIIGQSGGSGRSPANAVMEIMRRKAKMQSTKESEESELHMDDFNSSASRPRSKAPIKSVLKNKVGFASIESDSDTSSHEEPQPDQDGGSYDVLTEVEVGEDPLDQDGDMDYDSDQERPSQYISKLSQAKVG